LLRKVFEEENPGASWISQAAIEEILRALYVIRWKEELEKKSETPKDTSLVGTSHGMGYEIHLITEKEGSWIRIEKIGEVTIELHSRQFRHYSEDHRSFVVHLRELLGNEVKVETKIIDDENFERKIYSWQISSLWTPSRFQPPQKANNP